MKSKIKSLLGSLRFAILFLVAAVAALELVLAGAPLAEIVDVAQTFLLAVVGVGTFDKGMAYLGGKK